MTIKQTGKIPKWALLTVRRFISGADHLYSFTLLTMQGVSFLRGLPELDEALARSDGASGPTQEVEREREEGEKAAKLAHHEVDGGFPLLHAQGVVTLWSQLESLVRTLVADWLEADPGALTNDKVAGLKVKLGDYASRSGRDRVEFVVDLLEREKAAGLRAGANRFESLLACVSLDGPLTKSLRDELWELAQVRNAIAHRAGIADAQLIESCPWLGHEIGDAVRVDHGRFRRYHDAACSYALILMARVGLKFGASGDVKPFADQVRLRYPDIEF